ncbi:DUF6234 family protein [Streptomyces sp. NPDC047072]|uniref:DUF6234 family protein n=1 Tax=Streptomyces sp. NPDC047072 TaxID=3154809 RepID=UPI0033F330A4
MNTDPAHAVTYERVAMGVEPTSRGDGFTGGCLTLMALLIEIPAALLLALTSVLRGWGHTDEQTGTPSMDWVPIIGYGGFTLSVLVVAGVFLRSAHPFAGAVQLVLAAVALICTLSVWGQQYERSHPAPLPTCPTKAGVPCTPPTPPP